MILLPLAGLLALAWIARRQSRAEHGPTAKDLDPNLPPAALAAVLQALKAEHDPQKLRVLAATLPGYPKAQAALEARAKVLTGVVQQNVEAITALLRKVQEPHWRDKVQAIVTGVGDPVSLEILAGFFSVGEPAAAEILRLKIAALKGRSDYKSHSAISAPAVDHPAISDLFVAGYFQGCDQQPGCSVRDARFGNGPGLFGLDAGIAALAPEAQEALAGLLVMLPASFAKAFRLSPAVHNDPAGCFAKTLDTIDQAVRGELPMLGTALRYKAKFLEKFKDQLNAQARATLAALTHTGMTLGEALARGGVPSIVGDSAPWLRAQSPEHHSGEWSSIEDHMGAINAHYLNRARTGEWSSIEDHMGQTILERMRSRNHAGDAIEDHMGAINAHYLNRARTGEWSSIEDHMGQTILERMRGQSHAGDAIEDHMGAFNAHYINRDRPHAGWMIAARPATAPEIRRTIPVWNQAGWIIPSGPPS